MLRPLGDVVWGKHLVQRPGNSLLITPFDKKETHVLEVKGVGPKCKEVKVGDTVILPDRGGAEVVVYDTETKETENFFAIKEEHLLAIFTG